jgi:hypothetical protein
MKRTFQRQMHAVQVGACLATSLVLLGVLTSPRALADSAPQQPQETEFAESAPNSTDLANDDENDDEAQRLPPGHPSVDGQGNAAGPDTSASQSPMGSLSPSTAVAPGIVEVHVVDNANQPVPNASVELQIHRESVAEGNAEQQQSAVTDSSGIARFGQLSSDSAVSYRLLLNTNSAHYGLPPFQLTAQHGVMVTLHRLDTVRDIGKALVAFDSVVFVEPRDSVFQFDVVYRVFNVSQSVWVPDEVQIKLPADRQAVTAQTSGEDAQVQVSPLGVRLVGAITPGQHQLSFTFQVPRHNTSTASFEVGLPPNVMQARVGVASSRSTELSVDGFQEARTSSSQTGQRLLVAGQTFGQQKRIPAELRFEIRGLPTLGSGRIVAAVVAASLALLGLLYAFYRNRRSNQDAPKIFLQEHARTRLLKELADLEQARATGSVGPRTYEDTRTTLVEALVRLEPATE